MLQNKRFEVLDSFRGLCAISVLLYHLRVESSITELSFFRGGSLLVEFFFVLSGFVLAHGYSSKKHLDPGNFFISRTFRILPLHIAILAFFILLEAFKYVVYQRGIIFDAPPFTGSYAAAEIIPNLLLVHAWSDMTIPSSFNQVSWSISIEYYMYFILLATLLMSNAVAKYAAWAVLSTAAFYFIVTNNSFFQIAVLRGISCFFLGALTYIAFKYINKRTDIIWRKSTSTAIEAALVALTIIVVSTNTEFRQVIASFLFALVVLFFSFEAGYISSLLKKPPFKLFGKLSYSIYMTHAAILFVLKGLMVVLNKTTGIDLTEKINGVLHIKTGSIVLDNLLVVAVLIVTIAISHLTYRYIEVKGQNMGKTILRNPARTASISLGS